MSTYIDLHILQDLPPSNINRDDNGTPKHAVYGGVQRLRVSSQAWNRSTLKHFEDKGAKEELEQLIAKISDNNLKDILLNRIDAFKSKITDIKSQIDINLNQVDAFTKLDNKKLNAYIDKANSDIKVAISEFIEEKKMRITAVG